MRGMSRRRQIWAAMRLIFVGFILWCGAGFVLFGNHTWERKTVGQWLMYGSLSAAGLGTIWLIVLGVLALREMRRPPA